MRNYDAVKQWAVTINITEGLQELEALKAKYPWLRCQKSLESLKRFDKELPAIVRIITIQEKQNAVMRFKIERLEKYIELNKWSDQIILDDIAKKFNIEL